MRTIIDEGYDSESACVIFGQRLVEYSGVDAAIKRLQEFFGNRSNSIDTPRNRVPLFARTLISIFNKKSQSTVHSLS